MLDFIICPHCGSSFHEDACKETCPDCKGDLHRIINDGQAVKITLRNKANNPHALPLLRGLFALWLKSSYLEKVELLEALGLGAPELPF